MAGNKIKALIVDDEKIVRDFFKRLLSLLGLEAVDVEDGYKAIEMVKKEKFDIIFLDVRMPGLNGLETYREIRKIDPNVLSVMITGYAVEDILEQAEKEGVCSAIHKPFDINQIKEVIERVAKEDAKEPINVLVVDDDEAIHNFFSVFLNEKKLKFKIARDRNEALDAVKKEKFTLIFLDLVLKDVSGLDVFKEIKEIVPQANIVLITGHPQKAEEIKGKIEIAGCLYKPFDIESIVGCIEKIKSKING
jgi:two-component system, NtrC family, response regulator HydG